MSEKVGRKGRRVNDKEKHNQKKEKKLSQRKREERERGGLMYLYIYQVFANGPGDRDSIAGRVIPKTQKMVLDASLLNTQYYKVWI